ncbi:zinc finger and SCAN domain-containing protein 5B-like [Molossus molossus]|uniref:zinc finger and SCAN domain-containing protein 5B-like n=1 Tax=Molossus molossus TaxID=27622 RepID=UPI001745DFEA|nr:zinc finger and SCAN domain-containing protein 5B-like [Molossus molossus]
MVFRTFSSSEESDPVKDLHTLSRLCRHWLRPDLHTMEQILDKLVIEQFLISMSPELQVLVKESAVETCKDLENLLRKNEKPKKWTIVTIEGKMFLEKKSDVQTEEAEVSDMDHVWDLSMRSQSFSCKMEIHPEDSQEVNQELENQSGISEMSSEQGEKVLLPETIPKKGDLEGLSPTQMLEEDLMQDEEETTVLTSPEPQLLRGPGEKPYSCNFCKMTFTHESTLRGHQRVHTKERPYLCKVCHKSFSHKGNLNVHLRIHSDMKPYLCHECNQAFRQLGTLKRHQKTHINRTPQ